MIVEETQKTNRELTDQVQRLDLLLFCTGLPDFQKLDGKIKALINEDNHPTPQVMTRVSKRE